jgi:hypothetical protein
MVLALTIPLRGIYMSEDPGRVQTLRVHPKRKGIKQFLAYLGTEVESDKN